MTISYGIRVVGYCASIIYKHRITFSICDVAPFKYKHFFCCCGCRPDVNRRCKLLHCLKHSYRNFVTLCSIARLCPHCLPANANEVMFVCKGRAVLRHRIVIYVTGCIILYEYPKAIIVTDCCEFNLTATRDFCATGSQNNFLCRGYILITAFFTDAIVIEAMCLFFGSS